MEREPRDPALANIVRATVRVNEGSGVVIRNGMAILIATAAHVVRDRETQQVGTSPASNECHLLNSDVDMDTALLTAPPQFESVALPMADGCVEALPGDQIWGAGYPRGWNGSHALIAAGTVAGLGDQNWLNLDGTWGGSGGPVCRVLGEQAFVAGILLGNASSASGDLRLSVTHFDEAVAAADAWVEHFEGRSAGIERRIAEAGKSNMRSEQMKELGTALMFSEVALQGSLQAKITSTSQSVLAQLIEDHFRTGFLRFAPVTHLRKLF